jgi:hypothetical protein
MFLSASKIFYHDNVSFLVSNSFVSLASSIWQRELLVSKDSLVLVQTYLGKFGHLRYEQVHT